MKYDKILSQVKTRKINCERAFEYLSKIGYCPNLLNDDNGHWAVIFDGFQNVPIGDDKEDICTTCFIEAKKWKDSIYEALVCALENKD